MSTRQRRIETWGAALLGFVLGTAVGGFIAASWAVEHFREVLK